MSDGYPSSGRLVSDLNPPPSGPATPVAPIPWVLSTADADPTDRLTDAISNLAAAADAVNTAAKGVLGELPWEIAAAMLRTLRAITADHLGPIDASLTRHLYLTAPHGTTEVDGIGVMDVHRTQDRKQWDHWTWQHDVRGAIIEKHLNGSSDLYDLDGNEYNVMDLLDKIQAVHGAQSPKVTQLRGLGLKPEDYCEERPGKPSVEFR